MKPMLQSPLTTTSEKPAARVLLVDDNDGVRAMFATVLSHTGCEVETAANGADALQRAAEREFDVIVSDWEMPVLDGSGLVLALRSAQVRPPVVMLSGSFGAKPLPRAVAREVFAALEKPVGMMTFLATIAAAIQPALCAV